jgi:3-hydroxybutyryl-CoA dehydrogenase
MKILVIGDSFRFDECRQKLGTQEYTHLPAHMGFEDILAGYDVTFDFLIDENPEAFRSYATRPLVVFLNTCRVSLAALAASSGTSSQCKAFGFNGLPTLFNRELLEVSLRNPRDSSTLENVCRQLNTKHVVVDDRVGMVTPRIVCMIINEAYCTVQEGTATREDIDLAMKLGTNYPFGPFEWCERIGLKNVYRLLEAVYDDTKDERYKIPALLRREYLRGIADEQSNL